MRLPIDDSRPPRHRRPPRLGEHSEQVLREAGFSELEIKDLVGQ